MYKICIEGLLKLVILSDPYSIQIKSHMYIDPNIILEVFLCEGIDMKNGICCKSLKDDYVVCTCMEVMHSTIVKAISEGDDTFDKLADRFGVGTGCSSCVSEVHEILKEEKKSK